MEEVVYTDELLLVSLLLHHTFKEFHFEDFLLGLFAPHYSSVQLFNVHFQVKEVLEVPVHEFLQFLHGLLDSGQLFLQFFLSKDVQGSIVEQDVLSGLLQLLGLDFLDEVFQQEDPSPVASKRRSREEILHQSQVVQREPLRVYVVHHIHEEYGVSV